MTSAKEPSFESIEIDALERAVECHDPEDRLKWIEVAKAIQERRKTIIDAADAELRCKNSALEIKNRRAQFLGATLTPLIAVLITALALVFQSIQFGETAKRESAKNEDAQWQEMMKSVSVKDPKAAFVGALAMQSFFSSPRYGIQSRSIATALLPQINNVNGFDEIFAEMIQQTDKRRNNQVDLVNISEMITMSARYQHDTPVTALQDKDDVPPFLQYDVLNIDPNPDYDKEGSSMRDKVVAWELDTISQGLFNIWQDKKLPVERSLVSVTLEDASFAGLDLSKADLTRAILYHAQFDNSRLVGATLTNTSLREISLHGADMSQITQFKGSTWRDSSWGDARCMSPQLYQYLLEHYPNQPVSPALKEAVANRCDAQTH